MKRYFLIVCLAICSLSMFAQTETQDSNIPFIKTRPEIKCRWEIIDGDTVPCFWIREVYVFPNRFRNKRQENFYWRTVRDVKVVLPYAKLIGKAIEQTEGVLSRLPDDKARQEYVRTYSKGLLRRYTPTMKNLTARQGQLLMKLVDREVDQTSYEVIKLYKGRFVAGFWQGIARLFGNNLKEEYDGNDKDALTERIILLVENGQL